MSDENKTTSQAGAPILNEAENQQVHAQMASGKGKAKAVEDLDMDDDSSSEEEEQVSHIFVAFSRTCANQSLQAAPGRNYPQRATHAQPD